MAVAGFSVVLHPDEGIAGQAVDAVLGAAKLVFSSAFGQGTGLFHFGVFSLDGFDDLFGVSFAQVNRVEAGVAKLVVPFLHHGAADAGFAGRPG